MLSIEQHWWFSICRIFWCSALCEKNLKKKKKITSNTNLYLFDAKAMQTFLFLFLKQCKISLCNVKSVAYAVSKSSMLKTWISHRLYVDKFIVHFTIASLWKIVRSTDFGIASLSNTDEYYQTYYIYSDIRALVVVEQRARRTYLNRCYIYMSERERARATERASKRMSVRVFVHLCYVQRE